jgi:hypothetical protein
VIQAEASQAQPSESHLAQRCSNAVDGRHTVPRRRPPRMSAQALQRNPASQMASQTAGSPQGAGRARAASPSLGDGDRARRLVKITHPRGYMLMPIPEPNRSITYVLGSTVNSIRREFYFRLSSGEQTALYCDEH